MLISTRLDTFSQTTLAKYAFESGEAADQAEKNKQAKHQKIAQRFLFELIAAESTGVYCPSTWKLIYTIGRQIRQVTGDQGWHKKPNPKNPQKNPL